MEAKKKTITFQNKCLLNHIKVFIHFAPMPYLEHSLLFCVLPPFDRFLSSQSKNCLQLTLILDTTESRIYQNTLKLSSYTE